MRAVDSARPTPYHRRGPRQSLGGSAHVRDLRSHCLGRRQPRRPSRTTVRLLGRGRRRTREARPLPGAHGPRAEHPGHSHGRRWMGRLRLLRRRGGRGRAHAEHRPSRATRAPPHLLLLAAVLHAEPRLPPHRPPIYAARPAPPAHVRRARRPPRRDHAGHAALGPRLLDAGGGEVAPRRERRVPGAARGLRRLLRLPLRLGHVHGMARPALLSRGRLLRGAHGMDQEHALQPLLRPRRPRRGGGERRGGDHTRAIAPRRHVGGLLGSLPAAHGRRASAVVFISLHARGALRQLSARALPRDLTRAASLQGHHPRAGRHRGPTLARAGGNGTGRAHPRLSLLRQRSAHGDMARRRPHALPLREGLFDFTDLLPTVLALAGGLDTLPADRFIDGVDQSSFLLAPDGRSNRKYVYYWLLRRLSAIRVGEYKWMLVSTSDDDADVHGAGGFTGVTQQYTYPRLYNLYLDPKETHSYLTRKLAYNEAFLDGMRDHLATFRTYPPKQTMGLKLR